MEVLLGRVLCQPFENLFERGFVDLEDVLNRNDLPADAERRWQEGTSAERLSVLRRFRAHDASTARQWLMSVWRKEKADFRAEAIQTLEVGLSIARCSRVLSWQIR